jgi:hypothetical protein
MWGKTARFIRTAPNKFVSIDAFGLLERGGFGQAIEGIPGVVDENVDTTRLGMGVLDGAFDGGIVRDVEFKHVQRKRLALGQGAKLVGCVGNCGPGPPSSWQRPGDACGRAFRP